MLNLSANFHEKAITRNSRLNGEWGIKERDENLFEKEKECLNPIVAGKCQLVERSEEQILIIFLDFRRNIQALHLNL